MAEADLDKQVDLHFGIKDSELRLAAQHLARSGFEWADIRYLMSLVWDVAWDEGYSEGYSEGYEDRSMEGCCE